MSLKNCFAYLSDKKCACLSEMVTVATNVVFTRLSNSYSLKRREHKED